MDWENYFLAGGQGQEPGALFLLCKQYTPSSSAWVSGLYPVVYTTLKTAGLHHQALQTELNGLFKALTQKGGVDAQRIVDDFKVFSHFMHLVLNPSQTLPQLTWAELWPQLQSGPEKKAHYEQLMRALLGQHLAMTLPSPDMKKLTLYTVNTEIDKYESLMAACLKEEVLNTPTILDLFKEWIANLVGWLKQIITHLVSSSDELYQKVAARLLHHLSQLQLDAPTLNAHLKLLCKWYLAGAELQYTAFFAEDYTKPLADQTWGRATSRFLLGGHYLTQVLIPHLEKDIAAFKLWGQYLLRAAVAHADEQVAMDRYVEAYQRVRQEVSQWRGVIFEVRKKEEALLRQKSDYLPRLQQLDKHLLALSHKMTAVEEGWLTELSDTAVFHREAIKEANEKYFKVLHSAEVKKLAWMEWVHHTCCDFKSTEGQLFSEMNAINSTQQGCYFRATSDIDEHMKRIYTMTDYAMAQLPAAGTAVKRLMVPLHPDKLRRASLRGVAAYCTRTLTEMRQRLERVMSAWRRSQWGEVIEQGGSSLVIYTDEATLPSTQPLELVSERLDIGVFEALHQDYLKWMTTRTKPGLSKTVRGVTPPADMLYEGPEGDRVLQAFFAYAKQEYASFQFQPHTDTFRCQQEIESVEKEINEARQETLSIELRIKKAMSNALLQKMRDASFLRLVEASESEFSQAVEIIVEEIHADFEENKAEIRTLLFELLRTDPQFQAFEAHLPGGGGVSSYSGAFFRSAMQTATTNSSMTQQI